MSLLEITGLTLDLKNGKRLLTGISIRVEAGETVGLVGESGSGKSLTARSVLGLFPENATTGGSVLIDGHSVLGATTSELLEVRRYSAAMIFQDPRAGINPMRKIGDHMTESLRLCRDTPATEAQSIATELLRSVRLPRPEEHLGQYPHEFSGGMLQRVMIAGALTSSPKLLICDEPTTALDVTTQAGIIEVLAEQCAARGMGMLFITHDLNLAASICDRVYVMSTGRVEEQGSAHEIFQNPSAEYTKRLIAATPSVTVLPSPLESADSEKEDMGRGSVAAVVSEIQDEADPRANSFDLMLYTSDLAKTYYPKGKAAVQAVVGASIAIERGKALGVVGESGSGKSTLARMIVGLEQPDSGELLIGGKERATLPRNRQERVARAKSVQMVFQDPYLSLDPRIPVGRAIEDTLRLHHELSAGDLKKQVLTLLDDVGLSHEHAQALPKTLSGGQRQRVAIARAVGIEPELLVMDEATSALDVSVQAQVLDMVARIREEHGLTVLFISHDLGVVRRVCDETVVMRQGEIVEAGPTEKLLSSPTNDYTKLLIDSVPKPTWA